LIIKILIPCQTTISTQKFKHTIARSSAEFDYRFLSHTSAESTWLAYLLYELGARIQFPILLHYDNPSATYMASNPMFHARTEHIKLDYHFVCIVFALSLQ